MNSVDFLAKFPFRPPVIGQERNEELKIDNKMNSNSSGSGGGGGGSDEGSTSGTPNPKPPIPPKPSNTIDVMPPFTSEPPEEQQPMSSPKLSEKPNVETSPTYTGSETSRSFHPEGSIDLSPSCSESQPTTPSYLKWAESMNYLLNDGDGCSLFKTYLDQQSLGHMLEFVLAVKGFKIQMTESAPDQDLMMRLIKTINKRYINSLGKYLTSKIECFTHEQRRSLEEKINNKSGLDQNIFDGLYQTVIEHLESKCYPNFLTSEVYVEHVQSFQTQESEVASLRYQESSTASSVSGHPQKNADDSGISGITTSEKLLTESVASGSQGGQGTLSSSSSFPPSVTSPDMGYSASTTSCSQLLPTVKEDSELSIERVPISSSKDSSNFKNHPAGARPKTLMSRSVPSLKMSPTSESHPASVSVTSASYPYHANSSTWNPVSRQDSELQSQSSGAGGAGIGGDTTDDNYSR